MVVLELVLLGRDPTKGPKIYIILGGFNSSLCSGEPLIAYFEIDTYEATVRLTK
jgi:hypothetical protein